MQNPGVNVAPLRSALDGRSKGERQRYRVDETSSDCSQLLGARSKMTTGAKTPGIKMDITQEEKGSITVVSIIGSLDALTAPQLTDYLNQELGAGKNKLVMNLSRLDYTSSAGLRVLLDGVKESRKRGGDLRMAAAQANVNKVFEISGFKSILKFYPDVEGAVKSFG